MNLETVTAIIKKHEGCVLHCYEDHLGYMTIGVGRLIDKKKGGGITEDEAEYLLKNDIKRVVIQYCNTSGKTNHEDDAALSAILLYTNLIPTDAAIRAER